VSHAALSEILTPFSHALNGPWVPQLWDWTTEVGKLALNREINRQALTIAYLHDFRLMMYLTVLALPLLLLLRTPRARA
jgi:DHA2 family multidrug resistance protein